MSPAYDIVPMVFYQKGDTLALRFNGKRAFERITPHDFERMAGYVDVSPRAVLREISRTVEHANETWPALLKELPWSSGIKKMMAVRWGGLALFEGDANPFR